MAQVTVKLFASLGDYLPDGAKEHATSLDVDADSTIWSILDRLKVPRQRCHLVLVNGIFVPPGKRGDTQLSDGDTIAAWPPVAGG